MAYSKKNIVLVLMLFLAAITAFPQTNRYMVFFRDKSGTSFTTSQPQAYLSPKAIQRRAVQGVNITEQDFPVNSNYVQGVRNTGADVFFTTRWMNGVLVQCDQSLLASIQSLPFVLKTEFVAPQARLIKSGKKKSTQRKKNNALGIETQNQLSMVGINFMHEAGHRGEGVTIAVFDGGFPGVNVADAFRHIFSENRINMEVSQDFIRNTDNVFQYDNHGTMVLSVIAGDIPDDFTGGAYKANFQLYVTEDDDTEYRVEEYNWLFAAERADSAGADIIHGSLGYYDFDDTSMNYTKAQMDGNTAVVTKAAQWAADRGMLVVCSAGNEGNIPSWRIIAAPADARDVIAVGGVNSARQRNSSSSMGPTADGRIKPDLAALGVSVRVINENGVSTSVTGTSVAAPLVTSLAAGLWQRYPLLSNKALIALMKETASQSANPDNLLGYGIPNFGAAVNFQEATSQVGLFEVFPNPIRDTIQLSPQDPETIPFCNLEIISPQGQVVWRDTARFSWLDRTYKYDMRGQAAGIYIVRVSYGEKRYTFKVVKL